MEIVLFLDKKEMDVLFKQNPITISDGGFQRLMITLQRKCDQSTGIITLNETLLKRIRNYAFNYGQGGLEDRLMAIFGRHLGSELDACITLLD